MIDLWDDKIISIRNQITLLWISRSSVYYKPKWISEIDFKIMNCIDEIYTKLPFYWQRKIRIELQNKYQIFIWRQKIRSLMRLMWIETIYPKSRKTTISNIEHKKYSYLLKNIEIIKPNQVWSTDITYIRLKYWFIYLVAIIDWYSRFVLSWEISISLENDFCINALNTALNNTKYSIPDIHNSDQWSQFTSNDYTSILDQRKIQISMDWKWRCLDNIIIERLWRSVKQESVYRNDYESIKDAYNQLKEYFHFYNYERIHEAHNYKTPAQIFWWNEI